MGKEYEIHDPRIPRQSKRQRVADYLPLSCLSPGSTTYDKVDLDEAGVQRAAPLAYVAVGFACLAGLLFGYDIGCTSAVMAKQSTDGGVGVTVTSWFELSDHQQSLGMSASLTGAAVASVAVMFIGDQLGRRRELMLAGLLYATGSVLSSLTFQHDVWPHFWVVLGGRCVYGFGVAFAMHSAPMFIAEVAPASRRGLLVGLKEAAIVLGMVLGFIVAYCFQQQSGSWRWCFGLAAVPATALLVGFGCLPASPRWLRLQAYRYPHKYTRNDAMAALQSYRVGELEQLEEEMKQIEQTLINSGVDLLMESDFCDTFTELLQRKQAVAAGFGLVFLQQVTGQPAVLYYAASILNDAGFEGNATLAAAAVTGIKLVITLISVALLDSAGRRKMLFIGTTLMAVALLCLAAVFHMSPVVSPPLQEPRHVFSDGLKAAVVVCLITFVTGYQIGFGPVSWVMVSEVFPLHARGTAIGAAVAINFGTNLLMTYSYLTLEKLFTTPGNFLLYAILTLLSIAFIHSWVPETKGKTLEQIEADFAPAALLSPPEPSSPRVELHIVMGRKCNPPNSIIRRSPKNSPKLVAKASPKILQSEGSTDYMPDEENGL